MDGPLLIVSDDEPCIGTALRRLLHARDVEVFLDLDSDIVALAAQLQPDAILLDLLQKRDGLALLRELSRSERTRHIPVFLMSGLFGPDVVAESTCFGAVALGAMTVVPKPLPEAFVERLAEFIGQRTVPLYPRPFARVLPSNTDTVAESEEVEVELDLTDGQASAA